MYIAAHWIFISSSIAITILAIHLYQLSICQIYMGLAIHRCVQPAWSFGKGSSNFLIIEFVFPYGGLFNDHENLFVISLHMVVLFMFERFVFLF